MLRKLPFMLLTIVIIVMVAATLIEKQYGTASMIYGSWWFASLWALLVVSALLYCLRSKLHRRPATLLLHISFMVILAGALITHIWGRQGTVHLRMGQPSTEYITADHHVHHLPFLLVLQDFDVIFYPGTQSPMDYISGVNCYDFPRHKGGGRKELTLGECQDSMAVSMNRIGQFHHYRFYQSGYDPDLQGTLLTMSHDPWGIGVTYTGYALLFVAMLLMLTLPNEGLRKAWKQCCMLMVCLLFGLSPLRATPKTLPAAQASEVCNLRTYYNGRICPLQTVAKDFTTKICGKTRYRDMNFEQVFCGFVFYPTTWLDEPIIKVKREAAEVLGIEGGYASYNDFFATGHYKLEDHLHESKRAYWEADEKANILRMLWEGELLRLFPYQGQWYSQGDNLPMEMPQEEYFFIKKSLDYVGELVVTRQYDKLSETLAKIDHYQQQQTACTDKEGLVKGSSLPPATVFKAEKLYNTSDYTKPLAMLFAALGIVLFVLFVLTKPRRWLVWLCNLMLGLTLLYMLFLLGLRTYVSGHLPLSNGYETMQFMALCVLTITLMLANFKRFRTADTHSLPILPLGFLLTGLTLLVSMMGEANPQITLLMPVLQSPLLSIHVCVIMVAYTLLAFTFLNGITYFIIKNALSRQQITTTSRLLLYPALFCMAAGIFIGAIWANVSWGRYWGWDPKEVWALITLLVYSFAMHSQSLPFMRKAHHFHLFMILAFLSVLMTYFGVNFLLGGMHSYANS